MNSIHLTDVLIDARKMPPIRSQHTDVTTSYRSYRWRVLLGVVGIVAAVVAVGVLRHG